MSLKTRIQNLCCWSISLSSEFKGFSNPLLGKKLVNLLKDTACLNCLHRQRYEL